MTRRFIFFLTLSIILSCKQNKNNTDTIKSRIHSTKIDTLKSNNHNTAKIILETKKAEISLDTLIPIEILKKQSTNVYKKYGLEFTGNCYDCDLAEFRIENGKVFIYNVCDINEYLIFDILELKNQEKSIEIKTKKFTLLFSRVEKEPIFKLDIINYDFNKRSLRISEFYTFKENLMKFETHDCGDFDG
ncbi:MULTISPECIES: hypothetical protein [Bizionia]|uniref:Lipoprotein n=1 Tax=Bizionia algoritergicola TaxID=291187 RepID=A0A5D0QR51_9FLAO|nr:MULTISPECIES: hypothetical protein [Bizionia]OBX22259.1 hypothetical protein BAA08_09185 [Bizionia sp. APA-3]TYB70848.1 hypothetical protein ES675_15175 [Bizionia algoritergicola]